MKILIIILLSSICNILKVKGQTFKIESNLILRNDIYSNFSENNYSAIKYIQFSTSENILIQNLLLQDKEYLNKIKIAEDFYIKKEYRIASQHFSKAIYDDNNSGRVQDRIKLACSYSMIGERDSAFIQLFRIATIGKFSNLEEIKNEKRLQILHNHKEWSDFINIVMANRKKILEELNENLNNN